VKTSIATVSIAGSLREKITAISRAGFDGLEIFENDFVASKLSPSEFRKIASDHGLSIDLYQPFRDFEGVSESQLELNLERARYKFEIMHQLGVDTILACSNVATAVEDNKALFVDHLSQLADLAGKHSIKVAYEALAWGKYVSTYDRAWDLVRQVDHPNLGVCLDSFHILSRGSNLETISEIPGEKVFFLQLADAPLMSLDVLSWSRHHRLFPGEGGWDIADFVHRVLNTGYQGPLSLEIFNDVYRQGSPSVTARDGHRSLTYLQDEVRELRAAEQLPDLGLSRLPSKQSPEGFEFVEFAPGEGDEFEDMLKSLGFIRQGKHKRKNASLWVAGGARVVVNSAAVSRQPSLIGVGLDFHSQASVMDRMASLQYGLVPRDRLSDEADFGVVASPSGVHFNVSDAQVSDATWANEFGGSGKVDASGITGIDHVAIAVDPQDLDETTLFLRAALALDLQAELDLPSEYGLVRSRSANNETRTVRLALNVGPTSSAPKSGANHVAFSTNDIFATAAFVKKSRTNLLQVPENYYLDLRHRLGLDWDFIAQLQEYNILYDQDANGRFLHFYSVQLGKTFIEVVQRLGSYDGYGAYNSFIRLASQRAQDSQRALL
jgi:4-hydroxyphenylpyruvate dioxygenase